MKWKKKRNGQKTRQALITILYYLTTKREIECLKHSKSNIIIFLRRILSRDRIQYYRYCVIMYNITAEITKYAVFEKKKKLVVYSSASMTHDLTWVLEAYFFFLEIFQFGKHSLIAFHIIKRCIYRTTVHHDVWCISSRLVADNTYHRFRQNNIARFLHISFPPKNKIIRFSYWPKDGPPKKKVEKSNFYKS